MLPIHYPKELLTALDLLAVEVWGPPGAPRGDAGARIQPYVCSVARNALAFFAAGGVDCVDAVLFPHTCDSIQQLATLAPDFGGLSKTAITFLHPKGFGRPSTRRFLLDELRALSTKLEAVAGRRLETERLKAAIHLHRQIDRLRADLLYGRGTLPVDDRELYTLLRRGEWLWPEEHLSELRLMSQQLGTGKPAARFPILVTGYVPEPAGVLEAMNSAGMYVSGDDYAAVGRRVVVEPDLPIEDPWEALLGRYSNALPCPTRSADQDMRMRYLEALFERSGARGVVVHVVKFCEPELFDVPAIRRVFTHRGFPVLYLEGELERQASAQTVTRIEAFAEMLWGREGSA